jgi:formylglycine-generating enzyme required for sulfatase activity
MDHPNSAAGRLNFFLLSTHTAGAIPLNLPGFKSRGLVRVDLNNLLISVVTKLDSRGFTSLSIPVPNTPGAVGFRFDTQTVDIDGLTNDLAWADNDIETAVAPGVLSWATTLESFPDPSIVTDPKVRARMLATGLPWRVQDKASGIEMLLVPPGTFIMGASPGDPNANANESPAHQVTLTRAFYLGKTEVTQATWLAEMGSNPSRFSGRPDHPVEKVSWNDVQPFCNKNGLRLPTEAEWEYACRAGTTGPTYGVLSDIAWTKSNSNATSHKVGTKQPNTFGFHDMIGNVWEMTHDWSGPYPSGKVTDPTGPPTGNRHPLRGGSWFYFDFFARASQRKDGIPFGTLDNLGFRVARHP